MKIYIAHSSNFNYQDELYKPLKNELKLNHVELILPHENSIEGKNTYDIMSKCNLLLAEVSYASTGLGIELGRAESFDLPIIAIHREDRKPSSSIKFVTNRIHSYQSPREMIDLIQKIIKNRMN